MKKFLSLSDTERRNVFVKQKIAIGLPEISIEKDLWVTQVLHALFSLPVSDKLIFKGGTSLSKAWGLFNDDDSLTLRYVSLR